MEVYSLSGLTYTIPPATTGIIEFSGNSIPIQLSKGSGSVFSPDVLTLNSDTISSGRRKLGMLVYVYETKKIYQYNIDNYDTLWGNATGATGPGGSTIVISNFGTTVKNNTPEGQAFINAWTASTISGVDGYNDTNASWRVLSTGGSGGGAFTGGTVTGATIFTDGLTANTISAATYQNLSSNFKNEIHVSQVDGNDTTGDGSLLNPVATIVEGLTLITGQRRTIIIHPGNYTENPNITSQYTVLTTYELLGGNTLISGTISTNIGCTISGLKMTNLNISNLTGTGNVNILNCDISGTLTKSNTGDYTLIRFTDIGTTNITSSGGLVAIFGGNPNFITINNVGARVIVKNAVTVAPVLTAGNANFVDSILLSTGLTSNAITTSVGTIVTLANSQIIVSTFNNVARVSLSGLYSIFNCVYDKPNSTLVSPSGPTLTSGSTNSIDYFQYINADKFITQGGTSSKYVMGDGSLSNGFTGGTITGATIFTNGLTANTISATTYQNLPIDIRVTGGTYFNGTATFTNNTGGTFNVSGFSKMLWYAENSTPPTVLPTSVGAGSIVFGDGATSSGSDSFVFGSGATSTGNNLNVFGANAGLSSYQPSNSNFFGQSAGQSSYQPNHSNFFGASAGLNSFAPQYSNFLGYQAGLSAYQSDNSNFLGQRAGSGSQYGKYSNFFGYQAGSGITGSNNIIIGTNITLPNDTNNAINLGNVLFGINTYSGITGIPNSNPTIDGKIGIGVITPLERLHVSGNTRVDGGLTATTISATTYLGLPNTSFIRRHSFTNFDGSNSYDYNGYAPFGSSESANVWTITRLTINAFGSVTKGVATNVAWTDRVTVIYT